MIAHPHAFNWIIVALMLAACVRNAFAGNWLQAGYWLCGALINVIVTVGLK